MIPEYYTEISRMLGDSNDGNRVIWLPASHETTSIKLVWLSRNNVEAQLGLDNFSDSNFSPSLVSNLMDGISLHNRDLINNTLSLSQIKYVVVLKSAPNGINYMKELSYLKPISDAPDYVIYEVSNVYPKVVINPTVSLYSGESYTSPSIANPDNYNGFINVKDVNNLLNADDIPNVKNYLVTTRKASSRIDTTNFYWEANHWSWPQSRIPLDDPRYILVKAKETFVLGLTRAPIKRMDYLLWLVQET
jgi:hypothetical protein